MKKIDYRTSIACVALLATLHTSCVKDEGSYEMDPINEVTIGGLESSYSKIAYSETLDITPDLSGSIAGKDESHYTYKWLLKLNNVANTEEPATVIGTERNLHYTV